MHRLLAGFILLCAFAVTAHGLSSEKKVLICPITNRPFSADIIPVTSGASLYRGDGDADMGTDSDGARHSSTVSEYGLFVVTSPWSYFSALSIEWGTDGKFRGYIPDGFKEWITSREGFNSELVTDRQHRYANARRAAERSGDPNFPARLQDWEMPQRLIPIDKRYRLAIESYKRRRFPNSMIAKVALTGAWALRVQMNKPIFHSRLTGGYEEVDDKLQRHIEPRESFDVDKWVRVYKDIFHNTRLTDAGYFVAGNTYLGLVLRTGDIKAAQDTLKRLHDRYAENNQEGFDALRVLVRAQNTQVTQSYLPFLNEATTHFKLAIANEEVPRPKLPEVVLAIAESHRRLGQFQAAMSWYTGLARMAETQPRIRAEIRAAEGVPSAQASYILMLGWRADEEIEKLKAQGIPYSEEPIGADDAMLRAIIHLGMGTEEYSNPAWKPARGGDMSATEHLLSKTGKAILDYHFRVGVWPESLDSMWVEGYVRDRNMLNRFFCPVTGEKLRYLPAPEPTLPTTVLMATAAPVPTSSGPKYGIFLADNTIRWVDEVILPGAVMSPAPKSEP